MLESRNKICDAGYYCAGGATKPHPEDPSTEGGGKCTAGHYCPAGSSEETKCEGGFYETRDGSDACQECPEGYYCNGADPAAYTVSDTSTWLGTQTPVECSSDTLLGYCPAGSIVPEPCPAGRFSNSTLTRMVSIDDCVFCPEGKYCTGGIISGDCSAGFFCDFGAEMAEDPAKACPKGHYCPAGTPLPIRCDEGWYNPQTEGKSYKDCRPCEAGYYCIENDSVSRPCPVGHFCSALTTDPTPCRPGTYQPDKEKTSSEDCKPCPEGYFCDSYGIGDYEKWPCPTGHYCDKPEMITPPKVCPAGTY